MEDATLWTLLLLAMSSLAVEASVGQPSGQQQTWDNGLGAVVAQLVREQTAMALKQHAMESKLTALQRKLETTETKLELAKTNLSATETSLKATKTKLQTTEAELQANMSKLENISSELQASRADVRLGSSFVRWGRTTCPNSTSLVYVGVAGGKWYDQKGSGANTLCLTTVPQYDNTAKPSSHGYLYGAEYENIHGNHDHDVPCSVCLAPQSTTIMVPATLTCPSGWTPQYSGHLVAQYHSYYATEYVCLDGSPEKNSSGVRNDNGLLFYYVTTMCGSLPCPPYINDKLATCVVCSK